jgi:hypothetical protein
MRRLPAAGRVFALSDMPRKRKARGGERALGLKIRFIPYRVEYQSGKRTMANVPKLKKVII